MPKTTPKDFFIHLGVIVALYISVISLLTLLFQVINFAFPDQLAENYYYGDPYSGGIRWAIASLFIVFPLYLLLSWLLNRDYARQPEKRELWIRKWLIYITLFTTGIALATDLVTLIYYFLGGEITTRFILKILAVLLVTAGVFGYYFYDGRQGAVSKRAVARTAGVIALLVVIISIALGFLILGSPFTQRLLRFDERKLNDLQSIQGQAVYYWQQKNVLPKSLSLLTDEIGGFAAPVDPQTGKPYDYRVIADKQFELCADFNQPSLNLKSRELVSRPSPPPPAGLIGSGNETWQHQAGRSCFTRTIDPELYPPNRPTPKI